MRGGNATEKLHHLLHFLHAPHVGGGRGFFQIPLRQRDLHAREVRGRNRVRLGLVSVSERAAHDVILAFGGHVKP